MFRFTHYPSTKSISLAEEFRLSGLPTSPIFDWHKLPSYQNPQPFDPDLADLQPPRRDGTSPVRLTSNGEGDPVVPRPTIGIEGKADRAREQAAVASRAIEGPVFAI